MKRSLSLTLALTCVVAPLWWLFRGPLSTAPSETAPSATTDAHKAEPHQMSRLTQKGADMAPTLAEPSLFRRAQEQRLSVEHMSSAQAQSPGKAQATLANEPALAATERASRAGAQRPLEPSQAMDHMGEVATNEPPQLAPGEVLGGPHDAPTFFFEPPQGSEGSAQGSEGSAHPSRSASQEPWSPSRDPQHLREYGFLGQYAAWLSEAQKLEAELIEGELALRYQGVTVHFSARDGLLSDAMVSYGEGASSGELMGTLPLLLGLEGGALGLTGGFESLTPGWRLEPRAQLPSGREVQVVIVGRSSGEPPFGPLSLRVTLLSP